MPKASDSYDTATCSALMGRFLFRDEKVNPEDPLFNSPLQFCTGDREWVQVPAGRPQLEQMLAIQSDLVDQMGLRYADLPDDWGAIANQAGEILFRSYPNGQFWRVHYLGVKGGDLATGPATIEEVGIAPVPRLPRHHVQRSRG